MEVIKERFNELYIVTSCYHVQRASFIFKMVYGAKYELNFDHCVPTGARGQREKVKLDQARELFKHMVPGDDKELKRRISIHK